MGNSSNGGPRSGAWKRSKPTVGLQGRITSTQPLLQQVADRLALHSDDPRYHFGPGKLEKDYSVTRKVLGVGMNGGVRLATGRGRGSRRQFAVKTLQHSKHSKFGKWMTDLASELEIMLTVDHPHIIHLLDVYETPAELHFVMELADGGELFDRLVQRGRFSEDDAAEAARQMLSVVACLHSQGIVHRDLKPENLLYASKCSSHLKLIDFGCSRFSQSASSMSDPCGTLAYSAPEVLRKSCTSQSDLWSLGVIVFMLLSGYAPFEGDKVRQIADISVGKYDWRPQCWNSVSVAGIDFVKGLLCLDPGERLSARSALEHRWIAARSQVATVPNLHLDVMQSLCRFQAASKLRRSCLQTVAHHMTHKDIGDEVRNYFLHVDECYSGKIKVEHIAKVVSASTSAGDEEIQKVLNELSAELCIGYSDFLAAMVPFLLERNRNLMSDVFDAFDSVGSRSGQLSFQDFSHLVHGSSVVDESGDACPLAFSRPTQSTRAKGNSRRVIDRVGRWWDSCWVELIRHIDKPVLAIGASAYPEDALSLMNATLLLG